MASQAPAPTYLGVILCRRPSAITDPVARNYGYMSEPNVRKYMFILCSSHVMDSTFINGCLQSILNTKFIPGPVINDGPWSVLGLLRVPNFPLTITWAVI